MKKAWIIFLVGQVALFAAFYFLTGPLLGFDFLQKSPQNVVIIIEEGNVTTNRLRLNPNTIVRAYRAKRVTWTIAQSAQNVDSFTIKKKDTSQDFFDPGERPPTRPTRNGYGRIRTNAPNGEYEYSIDWWDSNGQKHTHDPKIAVKPSSGVLEKALVYGTYAVLAILIAISAFRRKI